MIPLRLTLKNFLSYRDATLDFQGLHTACICGSNGAGKSSLLEAIAWVIWGESRVTSEDDIIHFGTTEAQVDFIFASNQQIYRVIRTRHRGQGVSLEFQIGQKAEGRRQEADAGEQESKGAGEQEEAAGEQRSRGDGEQERISPHLPIFLPPHLPTSPSSYLPLSPSPISTFRSLTEKNVRATQQRILHHLKLDYDTFVNSAYLRQGRADEFMLRRPSERKQILADLLKLEQYDELAERAKERSRQFKAQMEVLERSLGAIQAQLQAGVTIAQEKVHLEAVLAQMQQQQAQDNEQLQALRATQHQRQTWQQQLTWQQQQQRNLSQDCHRLQQELEVAQQQLLKLEELLLQRQAIAAGFTRFQTLLAQEEAQAAKFQAYQAAQTQWQHYQQQQAHRSSEVQSKLQHLQAQLEALLQQEQEIQHTLSKTADVETALEQLRQARLQLNQLEQLQAQVTPLWQRRQQIQSQLDRHSTRLSTRLEELNASTRQLQVQQERQPLLQQAVLDVADQIEALEKRKIYQQRVREKGLERRSFMERLQENQRAYERQLEELEQKVSLLKEGVVMKAEEKAEVGGQKAEEPADSSLILHPSSLILHPSSLILHPSSFPPCPLCDRPLDEHHWERVLEKHEAKQQEILDQIWVIREQLTTSEREIRVLRQEYRDLDQSLALYGAALERRGKLQEQLQVTAGFQKALQQLTSEAQQIEQVLQTENYAIELQEELQILDQSLQQLNYDEKNHALARGETDRWRWAEIKQAEIKQAQRRQAHLTERQPELQTQIAELQNHLEALKAETLAGLAAYDRQLSEIGYDLEQHNALRVALREAQSWQLRYQELHQAQQQYPQMQQRHHDLTQLFQERQQNLQAIATQVETILHQFTQTPDITPTIQALGQQMQERRQQLDTHIANLGRLEQQQQQHSALSTQHSALSNELQTARHQSRIYQELAQAFGKNGIQALMIENVLPQLEAETNHVLGRLSANQLHVQFLTQRASKTKIKQIKSEGKNGSASALTSHSSSKLIDTLDIAIADARGTRPYETYSGGEAFRVNFAIRLALARLLAQRSGTALQMLIVDEGFGTQDQEGCDRLIAAINAIAPDFACILTITHMPHFREAFQARIEVHKTEQGSQLTLSM